MKSLKLPYRGHVRGLAAAGSLLYLAVEHPDVPGCGAYRVLSDKALDDKTQRPETACIPLPLGSASSVAVVADAQHAFVLAADGELWRVAHDSDAPTSLGQPLGEGASHRAMVLGGERVWLASDASVVALDHDGGEQSRVEAFAAAVTCLAVSEGGEAAAVGHADGTVTLLIKGADGEYERRVVEPHEAQIDAIALIAVGNKHEAIAFAADLTMSHTRLDDFNSTMRAPQKGRHAGSVLGIQPGPRGRFYSFSLDGDAKAWTDKFSQRSPATTPRAGASASCIMTLPVTNEKGEVVGQPHLLVVTRDRARIDAYQIDAGSEEKASDAGKLGDRTVELDGAEAWAAHQGGSSNLAARRRVIKQLGKWLDVLSLNRLMEFARSDSNKDLRKSAFDALTRSTHPRLPLLLETLMKSTFIDSARKAFTDLRRTLGEQSLRPMRLALKDGRPELGVDAVRALGERLDAADPVARAVTLEVFAHKSLQVARAAFEEIERVIEGATGSLLGLRSRHLELRAHALERLHARALLGETEVQSTLRSLRESGEGRIRNLAFLLTLLSKPSLATFVRAADEELHKQLVVIEATSEGLDQDARQQRLDAIPSEDAVSAADLDAEARALIMEIAACQQSDISLLGVVAQARTGDPRALPVLLLISQESDAVVRLRATIGLAALATMPAAEQRLRALIDDTDERVRNKAFSALSSTHPEPLQVVAAGLNSIRADIRMAALALLQRQLQEDVTELGRELLRQALFDAKDLRLALEASKTLRQILDGNRTLLLRTLLQNPHEEICSDAIAQLSRLVREAAEEARSAKTHLVIDGELGELTAFALGNPRHGMRHYAFERLHKILKRLSGADALLKVAIHCEHDDIRQKCLEVLDPADSWNQFILRDALNDANRGIRQTAFDVIGKTFKEAEHAAILHGLLAEGLGSRHDDIRVRALASAMDITAKERRDLLWQALFDNSPEIRTKALRALIEAQDTQAILAALGSPHRDLRVIAARGLAERGDTRPLPTVLQQLKMPKPKAPESDADDVARYRHDEALKEWYTEMEDALGIVTEIGDESAFETVFSLLELKESRLNLKIVRALGEVTPEEALDKLEALLRSDDKKIAAEAARALTRCGDIRGLRALWADAMKTSSDDRQSATLALGREKALDFVLKLIHGNQSESIEALLVTALQCTVTGGETLAFSAALTAGNSATRLCAAALLERSFSPDQLFDRLLELLRRHSVEPKAARERYIKDNNGAEPPAVEPQDWRRVGRLLAHASPRVRARVVPLVIERLRGKRAIRDFVITTQRLTERFGTEILPTRESDIDAENAKRWAIGAYTGIVRTPGAIKERLSAMRRLLDMEDDVVSISEGEVLAVLRVAVVSDQTKIRGRALNALQSRRERFGLSTRDIADIGIGSGHEDNMFHGLMLLSKEDDEARLQELMLERDDLVAYMSANVLLARALETRAGSFLEVWGKGLRSPNQDLRIITTNRLCYLLEQLRVDADINEVQRATAKEEASKQREALMEMLTKRSSLRDKAQNDEFIGGLLNVARHVEAAGITADRVRDLLIGAVAPDGGAPYPDVRQHIGVSLARIAEPGVLGVLREMLASDIAGVQQRAIDALATFKDPEASEALIGRILDDASGSALSAKIFDAIGTLRHTEVVPAVLKLIDTQRRQVITTVLRISGHDAPISSDAKWEAMTEKQRKAETEQARDDRTLALLLGAVTRVGAYEELDLLLRAAQTCRSTDQGVDEVLAKLSTLPRRPDTDAWRHQAIDVIGWRLRERGAPAEALARALTSKDAKTVFLAAEGLALGEQAEGLQALLKFARSGETEMDWRRRSIAALGALGDVRAVDFLLEIVGAVDKYADLYPAALQAIGSMSKSAFSEKIFGALRRAVESDNSHTTLAAMRGLHRFNTAEAWQLTRDLAKSKDWSVRKLAVELLTDDLDGAAATAVLLDRIEHDETLQVVQTALKSTGSLCDDGDTRPHVALYRAGRWDANTQRGAVDQLLEHGDAAQWLSLLIHGRREDARRNNQHFSPGCLRLEGALRSATSLALDAAVEQAQVLCTELVDDRQQGNAQPLQSLFDALIDLLGAPNRKLEDGHKSTLSTLTAATRGAWREADELVTRGRHEEAARRGQLEHQWRRLLGLLGCVGAGGEEINAALTTPRATPALTQTALLALERLPASASRSGSRELVATAAEHDVRVLAASTLRVEQSSEDAAAAIALAVGDLSVLQRLASRGDPARLAALQTQGRAGKRLALYELARLGDAAALAGIAQDADLDEAVRLEALSAMGGCAAAIEALAEIGRDADQAQVVRNAAWAARRRAQRHQSKQQSTTTSTETEART